MGEYAIKYLCALYINIYVCVQLFFCAIKRKIPVFYMLFQEYSGISNRIPYEISVQERRDEEMKLVFAVLLCLVAVFLQPLKGM